MRGPAGGTATARRWWLAAIVLLCAASGLAQAQSADTDNSADPPSRVARLSYMAGDIGFLPAGAKEWSDARINRPLTTGDHLSAGRDSRAELELGGGTLRIDGQTDFGLLDLNDQLAQVELTQGTLNLNVRHLEPGQSYEIDTPTLALVVDQPGTFRVDVDNGGRGTEVTVFDGRATVYGEDNSQRTVSSGRDYQFDDSDLATMTISDIGGEDAFDAWCNERDNRHAQSISRRYVSNDVVGYQDLDEYGDWQTTSEYGPVWFPAHVDASWAPYRDGHWAYIAPWGWTWVDDSPWGFAPYHYGRWAYVRGGWGWIPGPIAIRPVYAPALVAFVGGGGWSVGIGGGPVGWFPLGPGEIYNPWYRASRNYYTNVNITNIREYKTYNRARIINNIDDHYNHYRDDRPIRDDRYVNRRAPRGFTAVPAQAFASGRHVQRDLLRVDQHQLAAAPVLPRGANLRPAMNSQPPSSVLRARKLPTGGFSRDVMARHLPPTEVVTRRAGSGASHAGTPNANVHLLGSRGESSRSPARSSPDRAVFNRAGNAVGTAADPLPSGRRDNPAELRPGALPSARFAHPSSRNMPGRNPADSPASLRERMPRPGASFIAPAAESMQRAPRRDEPTLPRVPQIQQRTAPDELPPPASNSNRPVRSFNMPRQEFAPRPPVAARQNVPEQLRAMPEAPRFEPARQQASEPRFTARPQPVPQYAPPARPEPRPMQQFRAPPHVEAARPQRQAEPRSEPAPHGRPDPRDDRQH
jgi:hypothetical protein